MNWKSAMEIIILVLDCGSEKGKEHAIEELRDLAIKLDKHNAEMHSRCEDSEF